MSAERLNELAAGYAAGGLDNAELTEFRALVDSATPRDQVEAAAIMNAACLAALAIPVQKPSAALRERLMRKVKPERPGPALELLKYVFGADNTGWIALKVPGAYVKVLSMEDDKDYAVVLGKLDPGATYPAHHHIGPEEIYILSGDLFIGDVKLVAGDFHAAAAGSSHEINHSETGCTILAVLTKKDLMAQFAGV